MLADAKRRGHRPEAEREIATFLPHLRAKLAYYGVEPAGAVAAFLARYGGPHPERAGPGSDSGV